MVDTSTVKEGDKVYLSGTVVGVDRVRIDGLPFLVALDGGDAPVSAPPRSVVYHERTRPANPAEFRAMSTEDQDKMLERLIRDQQWK